LQILLGCAISGVTYRNAGAQSGPSNSETQDFVDIVDVLIRSGLTPPTLTWISFSKFNVYEKRLDSLGYRPKHQMTVWHVILVECYIRWSWNASRPDLQWLGHVLERYLEHGADPHFAFMVSDINPSIIAGHSHKRRRRDGPSFRVLNLFVGRETRELLVEVGDDIVICQANSLVEYLEFFQDHFKNWDRILQLVDRNLRNFGGPVQSEADTTEEPMSVEKRKNGMHDHPQAHSTVSDLVSPERLGETGIFMRNKTETETQGATKSPITQSFDVPALLRLGMLAFGIFVALAIQLWVVRAS